MDTNLQDDSLLLQFGVLEIQDYSDAQFRDSKIIQHQPRFVIADSINDFRIHSDSFENDQVGNKQANGIALVEMLKEGCGRKGIFSAQTPLLTRSHTASRQCRDPGC